MKLLHNWPDVIKRAWSVRLMILAALLSGAEIALPLVEDVFPLDRGVFAAMSFTATAGAFVARLFAQSNIKGDAE